MVLRDLESVLRQTLGNEIILENISTKFHLLSKGHLASTILDVETYIKKDEVSERKLLRLIAKMPPSIDSPRRILNYCFTFRKERFFYKHILSPDEKLAKEFFPKEKGIFNIFPKYYGSRNALNAEAHFDDGAVILLENLREKDFYTADKTLSLDSEHMQVAIQAMAKFHCLGIALKYKHPKCFKNFSKVCSGNLNINLEFFKGLDVVLMNEIRDDSTISKYASKCESALEESKWNNLPPDYWSTINHCYYCSDNIMFHKSSNGEVDDIKLIDFQTYFVQSSLRDLIFFIFNSLDLDQISDNLDRISDLYYENFIENLKLLKCDFTPFTKEDFFRQVNINASYEFGHCLYILRLNSIDKNHHVRDLKNFILGAPNEIYYVKLKKLVELFVERGWL